MYISYYLKIFNKTIEPLWFLTTNLSRGGKEKQPVGSNKRCYLNTGKEIPNEEELV